LENACPTVSRDWIRALLQKLRKEGKVEALGKGRYARWRKV
jgi:predicted transcriptional regulator of viral defense system